MPREFRKLPDGRYVDTQGNVWSASARASLQRQIRKETATKMATKTRSPRNPFGLWW